MSATPSILVIDDDPDLLEVIGTVAQGIGIACETASDAATFFAKLTPDVTLVVIDLVMPGLDGVELLRALAQQRVDVNVLLMSGLAKRVMETAERLGTTLGLSVVGHLRKPFGIEELEACLASAHRSATRARASPASKRPIAVTEEELRQAIERDEFVNHYQPQIDVASESLVGVEALVRWKHPVHGLVFPDSFIPMAEQLGLIDQLGWLVARRGFSDRMRFAHGDETAPSLSLNVSVHSLQNLDFPDRFAALAHRHGVSPEKVILEVTESGLVRDFANTLDVLTRLRLKGFELSIDDFGSGYSMMQQLHTIPATELKVDKSFVQNALTDQRDGVMVVKTIEIGHELGLRVTAEGVETQPQLDFIREKGCDTAQGYLFSRPLPVDQLIAWMRSANRDEPARVEKGWPRLEQN